MSFGTRGMIGFRVLYELGGQRYRTPSRYHPESAIFPNCIRYASKKLSLHTVNFETAETAHSAKPRWLAVGLLSAARHARPF